MVIGFDPSVLANYYFAKLPLSRSLNLASPAQAGPLPPWDLSARKPPQQELDVTTRSSDPYFDPKDRSLFASPDGTSSASAGSQLEALLNSRLSESSSADATNTKLGADNHKLFGLYQALDRLDYIAKMANRDGTVMGQRPGLDKNFQDGRDQILAFLKTAEFANLTVLPTQKTATAQGAATIAYPRSDYTGGAVMGDTHVFDPVPGVSASDGFTISITKAGVTTGVVIDLANVTGAFTLDNINAYVNQQLAAGGFATRFTRVQTGGSIAERTATWGEQIVNRPGEVVTLSSGQAQASVYVAGTSGKLDESGGKLIKFTGLDTTPTSAFSANIAPESGTMSAKAAAVDANGNVYVIGNTTGSFGSELNQATTQDAYLTKYDSAGNVQWTKLLGAADSASAFGLAVDPLSGGVVISGSVSGKLTPTALGGNGDSFVAKYDSAGNEKWVRQMAPVTADQANSVSVDSSGNIYVGGQVTGVIASGQTSAGGQDAYLTKLDKNGTVVFQRQFGSSGSDAAVQTGSASDGGLIVASQQNGRAILTKYASTDGTSAAIWEIDLGDLQGGSIGGLAIANDKIYLSGTTANASLNAGGASITHANSGGTEAFVFGATDNGGSATSDFVSYVGTAAAERGGGVAVANGKIYLTGSTTGTFAGQTRSVADRHNLFLAQLESDGWIDWIKQYGGQDGESRGFAIAADAQGASVLDALKLPRGKIDSNASNAIESQTTARAGDYFIMEIEGRTGTRKSKITIAKGETIRSLALKINAALLFDGKGTALPVKGGQTLKIALNEGVQVRLVAGPKDLDALAGLGLKPQLLTKDKPVETKNTAAAAPATGEPEVIGLGIDGKLDLLTKQTASHAHVVLQGAMALIKQAYNKFNAPPESATAQTLGPVPGYLQNQIASYQTALAWMSGFNR